MFSLNPDMPSTNTSNSDPRLRTIVWRSAVTSATPEIRSTILGTDQTKDHSQLSTGQSVFLFLNAMLNNIWNLKVSFFLSEILIRVQKGSIKLRVFQFLINFDQFSISKQQYCLHNTVVVHDYVNNCLALPKLF